VCFRNRRKRNSSAAPLQTEGASLPAFKNHASNHSAGTCTYANTFSFSLQFPTFRVIPIFKTNILTPEPITNNTQIIPNHDKGSSIAEQPIFIQGSYAQKCVLNHQFVSFSKTTGYAAYDKSLYSNNSTPLFHLYTLDSYTHKKFDIASTRKRKNPFTSHNFQRDLVIGYKIPLLLLQRRPRQFYRRH